MIYLYFWSMSRDGVGHLSMQLSDGTYISFWPSDTKRSKSAVTATTYTYDQDVAAEGRGPDEVLDLPDDIADQDKISAWWKDFVRKNKYHLFDCNCALVVQQALREGGIYETHRIRGGGSMPFGPQIAPEEILNWAQECKRVHCRDDKCTIS